MNILNINIPIGDIVEPDEIQFSFGAPGWYIIILLTILLTITLILINLKNYRKNKYRRDAIKMMNGIMHHKMSHALIIYHQVELLKRIALHVYGRSEVAHLTGAKFYEFLQGKSDEIIFSAKTSMVFTKHLYEGESTTISKDLLHQFHQESIHWIKAHNV